jgi:hypothetical protein
MVYKQAWSIKNYKYIWDVSPSMLFLYGERPLVNCGPRSILLHIYITLYCKHRLLSASIIIYLLQTNILFHTIRLILCF